MVSLFNFRTQTNTLYEISSLSTMALVSARLEHSLSNQVGTFVSSNFSAPKSKTEDTPFINQQHSSMPAFLMSFSVSLMHQNDAKCHGLFASKYEDPLQDSN